MNKIAGILLLFIYICVATTLLNGAFVGEGNLQNLLLRSSIYGVIGIGAAFVIITGGIDLSIGSVIGLLSCLLPMLLVDAGWSVAASLSAVMVAAMAIGLVNGLLVTKMKLQPFVVTLCGLLIYRGLARYVTGDVTKGFGDSYQETLRLLATGSPCSAAFIVMVAGAVLVIWFLVRSVSGKEPSVVISNSGSSRAMENLFGFLAGAALCAIGSSRFWHGFQIQRGGGIEVMFDWRLPTWHTQVPEAATKLPAEGMWWCGLLAIPFGCWFVWIAWRGDRRFWRSLVKQVLMIVVCLPFAIVGATELLVNMGFERTALPFSEATAVILRRIEVFAFVAAIMSAIAWFFWSGLRAGGTSASLPAKATACTAIMWLVGKSQFAHDWLWEIGTPDELMGLAGRMQLMEILVPSPFFVLLLVAIVAAVFLNLTIYGRYLLALGHNEQAARYSGIRTDRMVILAYVICSTISGLGAILFVLNLNSAQPAVHGNLMEMYAIAAAVLGGCSLRGGEGSIFGVIIGAAVMRVLYNSIGLIGISSQLEYTIVGLVILMGVSADEIVRRMAARRRAAEQAAAAASRLQV